MKKFRIIAIVSVLALVVGSFSGCVSLNSEDDWFYYGKDNASDATEAADDETSEEPEDVSKATKAPKDDKEDDADEADKSDDTDEETTDSSSDRQTSFASNDPSGDALSVSEVYANNVDCVVGITTESTTTNIFGQVSRSAASGTGIILSTDGYILTNCHVVESGTKFTVTLYNGTSYDAKLVGSEATNDVAVLKIEASGLKAATIGNSDKIVVGEDVMIIGNPLGELTYSLSRGVVSALNRTINTDGTPITMFQIDASVNSGNSGGPAFNAYGQVIGMVTAKYASSSIEGLGFCIPINDAVDIAEQLINDGYVKGKGCLDVVVQDAYSYSFWGSTKVDGAYVTSVVSGGAAEKAGIKEETLITSVNDTEITSASDLATVIVTLKAGETVTIKGTYNKSEVTYTVTLSEYTPDKVATVSNGTYA